MTDRDKVIRKIAKLLRQARSTSYPAEAQSAIAVANRLLLEHHLSQRDIVDPADLEVTEAVTDTVMVLHEWRGRLLLIIAQHFRCEYYVRLMRPVEGHSEKRLTFFGAPIDVAMADQVYAVAIAAINRQVEAYMARDTATRVKLGVKDPKQRDHAALLLRRRNAFIIGWLDGLYDALHALQSDGSMALMVAQPEAVQRAWQERQKLVFGDSTQTEVPDAADPMAQIAGYQAGRLFRPQAGITTTTDNHR